MTRIVVHDYGGYSFPLDLSRALAGRGHEVLHLHPGGFRQPRADVEARPSDPTTLAIEEVRLDEPSQQHGFVRRLRQESRYGSRLSQRIATFKPQVTISANTPLGPQSSAARATSAAGAAFIFWVQDLYSVAVSRILERRLGGLGTLIGRRFESAERRILRGSDAVVAIAPEFTPVLESWGVVPERVTVIENWASLDLVRPKSKRNRWSEANGLGDVPVLMYAGTLGRKHDPALLVHLAQALPDVKVVVVAEGAGADALRGGAMPENLLTCRCSRRMTLRRCSPPPMCSSRCSSRTPASSRCHQKSSPT
jgi:glycosyltransferase involved in cell wall biosynthesis